MSRARGSGITLNKKDAAIVKGMLARRDRQQDIAAWFGVNSGRISEIKKGSTFNDVSAKLRNLPPVGPYLSGRASEKAKSELRDLQEKAKSVLENIDKILEDL